MKKLLFGLIATLMLGVVSYGQNEEPKDPPLIELQFGRVSKNCGGFGICKFKIHLTTEAAVQLITVIATATRPDGAIKAIMTPEFYKKNGTSFQSGYLLVEEDYTIDKETTRAIGVPDNYTIKKGKYQVVFDKNTNTFNCTF